MLKPPPNVSVSEWATKSVRIPEGNAVPGLYRLANAPYQREPMDMSLNPDCYRISLMWGAQVGKTLLALCIQGFGIEVRPRSQMMMQPSQGDLTTWLETKFNPLVDASAAIRRLIAKPRGRTGVNNQRMKSYPGGFLMFAWSGSTKTMRGRSAPLIVCDEVDGYEVTEEGHPVSLVWQRAATFDDRLLVEISTPTVKDGSYIEKAYDAGDQRQFYVPCPDCGEHQTLKWENVYWPGRGQPDAEQDPTKARYVCDCCGTHWNDGQRIAAIRTAESVGAGWKAAKPFKGHASYHINEFYSVFRKLRDIVQSYLDKMAADDEQAFVNVSLAQTWEVLGEKVDPSAIQARAETFTAQVPAGAVVLTAGIDMQKDRLEGEIVAWGEGEESWSVEYFVLWGDPLNADVWEQLDDVLARTWQHESGAQLAIQSACLDTGGTDGYTQAAYDYAKGKTGRRLFAVKGKGGWGVPVVAQPSRKQSGKDARKVDLFLVGTDEAKKTVMRRFAKTETGPGYCHTPAEREKEWYDQITAEKLVKRTVKGFTVLEWHQTRDRNEALDCRVYAYAALKILNPNLVRLAERIAKGAPPKLPPKVRAAIAKQQQAANDATATPAANDDVKPQEGQTPQESLNAPVKRTRRQTRGKRKGGFVQNW